MKRPLSFSLFSHSAVILLLVAICSASSCESIDSEVLATSFKTQETKPTSERESTDLVLPKKQIVHPEVLRIPAKEVKELLAKKADFVLVDTNPADYFELWHIPTAINIPYISMVDDPANRESMLAKLPKDKLIVIYCLCEEGADSSEMALILRAMDYRRDKVKVLEGGLIKWDEAGYPMIKTEVPE
jgi:rhodanese-related sulfurtransferase